MARLTAMICKGYGITLLYFNPQDVNVEKKSVKAKILIEDSWIDFDTSIPKFIDVSQYCYKRKNRERMAFLRENTFLSDNGLNRMSKEKLQSRLK